MTLYGQIDETEQAFQRALRWMASMGEDLGWFEGMALTGLSLRKFDWGWRLVVNAASSEGKFVAFFEGHDVSACLAAVHSQMRNPGVTWHKDRYR